MLMQGFLHYELGGLYWRGLDMEGLIFGKKAVWETREEEVMHDD